MSFARKFKRRKIDKAINDRKTCPKCHYKLVEKYGYGLVCANCGWHKSNKKEEEK